METLKLFYVALLLLYDGMNCENINHLTKLGSIIGTNELFLNENVYLFKKIPFAKPPIGNLRFRKPQEVDPWNGTLDATEYGPSCWQTMSEKSRLELPNGNMSEDCLYLNIFVPRDITPSKPRAVMVWIHGGSFSIGQGMRYDGKQLALHGDIIVVTINYRLNVFGFFSTGDRSASGNYGIWDQREAIVWVKNNIADYGGNPSQITVFGESAGGVSVSLQIVIPKNVGLFQRAIVESGCFLGPRDFATDTINTSFKISKMVACLAGGTSKLIECVKNTTAFELFNAYSQVTGGKRDTLSIGILLSPISDGDLIPHDIRKLVADPKSLASQTLKNIDLMAGNTDGEAGLFLYDLFPFQKKFKFNVLQGISSRVLCKEVIPAITAELYSNCSKISDSICEKYSNKNNTSLQEQTELSAEMYGDLVKVSPIVKFLNYHSQLSNKYTYQYMFTHKPTKGVMPNRPPWLKGANHADEIPFIFGIKDWYGPNISSSQGEIMLSHRIMDYWTNFAKNGNPNGNKKTFWSRYDITLNEQYMNLSLQDTVGSHLWKDRMQFWNSYIPVTSENCFQMSSSNRNSYSTHALILLFVVACVSFV